MNSSSSYTYESESYSVSDTGSYTSTYTYEYDSDSSASFHSASTTEIPVKKGKKAKEGKSAGKSRKEERKSEPNGKGVQFSWDNVVYDVEQKKQKKRVLHGCSGYAAPGTLTAIIGPSGAGKTSLLRILARKIPANQVASGEYLVDGEKVSFNDWSHMTAFVAQEDVLLGTLTVKETFEFAATLKLADGSNEARDKVVNKIIQDLGLENCRDTFNGYTGAAAANSGMKRGISGGERKRVSIGLELLTQPKLLFLDEPTSGLDSYAAKSVMVHLKKLARGGQTIISTIHQPSAAVFALFDNLIILAEGRTLYNGPAANAIHYFADCGFKCPPHRNPADYFIKILFLGNKSGAEGLDAEAGQQQLENTDPQQVTRLAEFYEKSEMKKQERNPPPVSAAAKQLTLSAHNKNQYTASWGKQFVTIFKRSTKNTMREPLLFQARVFQTIVMALLAGLIYLRLGRGTQVAVQDRTGAIFFTMVSTAFSNMNGPMLVFPSERAVYFRENAAGLYSTSAYFLGKIMSEAPIQLIVPAVFTCISYWMINFLATAKAFFVFMLILTVLSQVPYAMALVITCAIKNQAAALQFQPLVMLPFMLLSGFYLNTENIPVYFRWLEAISFIKYGFRAGILNEFRPEASFGCSTSELNQFEGKCPIVTGPQQVTFLGFSDSKMYEDIAVMAGMYGIYMLFSYLLLRFSKKE